MSGLCDPAKLPAPTYYGEDVSKYPSMASIKHVEGRKIPVFIAFAEFNPYHFDVQTVELVQALSQRDKACPAINQLVGHNHLSEICHINTSNESIGPDIFGFVRTHASSPK